MNEPEEKLNEPEKINEPQKDNMFFLPQNLRELVIFPQSIERALVIPKNTFVLLKTSEMKPFEPSSEMKSSSEAIRLEQE